MDKIGIVLKNFIDNLSLVGYEFEDKDFFVDDLLELITKHDKKSNDNLNRAEELYKLGENYYLGLKDCSKDIDKATELYKQALKLGWHKASYRLGHICEEHGFEAEALSLYNIGAAKGCYLNYARIAMIYLLTPDFNNANTAWSNFFNGLISDSTKYERYEISNAIFDYFISCSYTGHIKDEYLNMMFPYVEDLIKLLELFVKSPDVDLTLVEEISNDIHKILNNRI